MSKLAPVGEGNFINEVLESEQPVLVDFTATWCGPCKMLNPVIETLAQDWDGQVKIVKLDVDDNPGLAAEFQVLSVPTLMLFKGGKPLHRTVGYKPKDKLVQEFVPHFNK